ncbi:MAG: hypothetical protein AAGH65_09200 [Pseudomonadota bacterium]
MNCSFFRISVLLVAYCISISLVHASSITVLNTFTIPDTGDNPQDTTWDGNSLWVAELNNTVLLEIDPNDGSLLSEFEHPGNNPNGLTFDGTTLFISDDDVGGVGVVFQADLDGNEIGSWTFGPPILDSEGLAYDGDTGNIWLTDDTSNMVFELDADDGTIISSFEYPGADPDGITWRDGQLFVVDEDTLDILQLDTNGNLLGIVSIAELGINPRGITWDGTSFWLTIQDDQQDEPGQLVQLTATFTSLAPTAVPTLSPIMLVALMLILGMVAIQAFLHRTNRS